MQWSTVAELWIPGVPVQQGSKNAIPAGRRCGPRFVPVTRSDGMPIVSLKDANDEKLKPWRSQVTTFAMDAWGGRAPIDGPVCVHAEFVFPRLKGHYGTGRNERVLKASAPLYKDTAPDKDKLERALFDGITDSGLWRDDCLVVDGGSRKVYGPKPGVRVRIQVLTTKEGES